MGKFKKGLMLGGLLGAGFMWLNTTKKGREVRENMLDQAAVVYADVKKKVLASKNWNKLTKQKYVKIVRETIETYAKNKNWSANTKKMVMKLVENQWKNIKSEIAKRTK